LTREVVEMMKTRNIWGGLLFVLGLVVLFVPVAFAASVDPVYVAGNPKCSSLGLESIVKFDPPNSGTSDGVTLTVVGPGTVDWSSTVPIGAVIVKGGPNANLYFYDGATSDTGLVTPTNPHNGKLYGLSHVDFCAPDEGGPEPSESPSEEPTVEPTVQPTQTSDDDDTDVLGEQHHRKNPQVKGNLATTGAETWAFGLIGGSMSGIGMALRVIPVRRRRRMS
jgi:hypothetical protein